MVYYGHETASAQVAASALRRLSPNRMVRRVEFLVSNHMINYSREWSDRAVRRFARKMGRQPARYPQSRRGGPKSPAAGRLGGCPPQGPHC